MAWAPRDDEPYPPLFKNFTGIILTLQLTPTTPSALLPAAPMIPATWVPWPLSSIASVVFDRKFQPLATLPLISGWFLSIPVSTAATVIDAEPVDSLQAPSASIFFSPHKSA